MARITTKTGDAGMTRVAGRKLSKGHALIELLGGLDEAVSRTYWAQIVAPEGLDVIHDILERTMQHVGGARSIPEVWRNAVMAKMEKKIAEVAPFVDGWFIPDTEAVCRLDLLRTAVRKVELLVWRALNDERIGQLLNRASDYVFALEVEQWRK